MEHIYSFSVSVILCVKFYESLFLANDMDRNQSKRKDFAELKDLDDAISNLKILTRSVSVYRYDKVHLGLAQTIISKCFKGLSQRASFVITVFLHISI